MIKKKSFLCIVILGFFWCNFAQSEDCSLIDHDKYKDDFIQWFEKDASNIANETVQSIKKKLIKNKEPQIFIY